MRALGRHAHRYIAVTLPLHCRYRCALSVVTRCFERCSVAQPFDGPPLRGNPLNIVVAPQGWLVVGAWLVACTVLAAYRTWLARRARAAVQRGAVQRGAAQCGVQPGEPLRTPSVPWSHGDGNNGGGLGGSGGEATPIAAVLVVHQPPITSELQEI